MAGGQWNAISAPAATTAAVAVKASAGAAPFVNRCRSLTVSVTGVGAASGIITAILRDGATGAGTPLWEAQLQAAQDGGQAIALSDVDFRSSIGNALTLDVSAPGGTGKVCASMSGDIVPSGYVVGSN